MGIIYLNCGGCSSGNYPSSSDLNPSSPGAYVRGQISLSSEYTFYLHVCHQGEHEMKYYAYGGGGPGQQGGGGATDIRLKPGKYEDFDSLTRISIHTFLNEYNVNDPIFFLEQLCSISVEIDFFFFPFLSKPSVNAPNDIIKFMEIFSKQARIKEDFQYYFAFPYDYESETNTKDRCKVLPLRYDYSQLEIDNPFKKVLDCLKIIHHDNKPDSQVNDESNNQSDSQVQDESNKQLDSQVRDESNKTLDSSGKSKDQGTDSIYRHQNHFCNIT